MLSLRVCSAIRALLSNPAVGLEFHLQQLMPAVFTCVVAAKLCGSPEEVRQYSTIEVLGHSFSLFSSVVHSIVVWFGWLFTLAE
jgi:hypothetical protein